MQWTTQQVKLNNKKVVTAFVIHDSQAGVWAVRAPYRHSEYFPAGKWTVAYRGETDLVRTPSLVLGVRVARRLSQFGAEGLVRGGRYIEASDMKALCDLLIDLPVLVSAGGDYLFGPVADVREFCVMRERVKRIKGHMLQRLDEELEPSLLGWPVASVCLN